MTQNQPSINTLIEDVQNLFTDGVVDFDHEHGEHFANAVYETTRDRLSRVKEDFKPALRMSILGTPCERKLWYMINASEKGEVLPPSASLKFLYGDILEEFLLYLAEVAGHKVEGRQDTMEVNGVKGHRDAVIDGCLVDVKSASSFAFKKFENDELFNDDPFGYITQLQTYLQASQDDPLVTVKDKAYFFVVDKTLGHICLMEIPRADYDLNVKIDRKREVVNSVNPPQRGYTDVPEGKSGNKKLRMECSYCQFKKLCWPGMRTFLYSNKPIHLTVVNREPKVPELKE